MIAQVTDWADSIGAVRMRSPLSSRSRRKVLTAPMLSGAVGVAVEVGIGDRGNPAPLLFEAPLVLVVPLPGEVRHLRHRQADAAALDAYGPDLSRLYARLSESSQVVVVLEERARKTFVQQADAIEHRPRCDPEGAVKRARLDSRLADHLRARDDIRHTEVVHVAAEDACVVPDGRDVVALRE